MWKINDFWWRIDFLKNIWYTSSLNWCWMQNWAIYQIRWLGHIQHSPENGVGCLRWPFVWKCLVSDPIDLCITKSWLLATSTTFFRNIKMWQFLIFQILSRPPPRKLDASKMASDCSILNLFTSFWILRHIYDTWFLNFFYVDVSLKLAILHHNKYWRLEIFDQYFTFRCDISNVAKMF